MNFICKFSVALLAACLVASSASAITVTHKTSVGSLFAGYSGAGTPTVSAGDSVTLTFDIDENQVTKSNFAGDYGHLYTDPGQVDNGTHIAWSGNREVAHYWGAQYSYSNMALSFDSIGKTFQLGSGVGVFEVFERNPSTLAATDSRYTKQFGIYSNQFGINLTFGWNDPATPFSTDFSQSVANIGTAQPFSNSGNGIDASVAILQALDPSCTTCGPRDALYVAFSGGGFTTTNVTNPNQPPVSAVPVPAPFAMLGLAFAGLIGFKHSRKA